jgi:MYXO-CTERM domain-containing protein
MKTFLGLASAMIVPFGTATSFADVIPPEVLVCNALDAGAPCPSARTSPFVPDTTTGSCQSATCSRIDYSQGTPPVGSVQYPCLKCIATGGGGGVSATGPNAGSAGRPQSTDGGAVSVGGAAIGAAAGEHQDVVGGATSVGGAYPGDIGGAQGASVGGTTSLESAGGKEEVGSSGESSSKSCTCTAAGHSTGQGYGWALLLGLLAARRERRPHRT